jgi:hypothetical protein
MGSPNESHTGEGSPVMRPSESTPGEAQWWNSRQGQIDPYTGQPLPGWDEIQTAIATLQSYGLPQEQFEMYLARLTGNPSVYASTLSEAMLASQNNRILENEQKRQGYLDTARQDIQGLRDTYLPEFDQQIARFADPESGLLRRNFIYEDPLYGNVFSQARGAVDQQIQQVRQNAALQNANAGVRASGKSMDTVQGAEQGAAAARGQMYGNLFGEAQGELTGLQDRRRQFDTSTVDAMNQTTMGFMPHLDSLNQMALNSSPTYDTGQMTGADFHGQATGENLAYLSLLFNTLLGGAGVGQNSFDSLMGALPWSGRG